MVTILEMAEYLKYSLNKGYKKLWWITPSKYTVEVTPLSMTKTPDEAHYSIEFVIPGLDYASLNQYYKQKLPSKSLYLSETKPVFEPNDIMKEIL